MALTKKAVNDHFLHSFGQIDEPVRSRTGNDGLIIGGVCENSGTVTAVEHGDFAALHFDNDQNLMVNVVSGEIIASLGTVDLLKAGTVTSVGNLVSGTVAVVSSVANLAAGTVTSIGNVVGGTVGVVSSVANLAAGTVTSVSNLVTGTVAVLTALTGGGVAANAADSGNPVKMGGKYVLAGVTLDDGDRGDIGLDSKSNVNVNLNTLISGEDQTNDVLKTEERYSYYHYVGTAGAVIGTVKASAGRLSIINVNTAGTSPVTIYDSVGTSATVVGIISSSVEQPKIYNIECATGITLSGTSAVDITVSYK